MAVENERQSKEVLANSGFAYGVLKSDSKRAFPQQLDDNLNTLVALAAGINAIGYLTPPTILASGEKDITTAGTREALGGDIACRQVIMTAKTDNTNYIYIGGNNVSSTIFMKRLLAGEEFTVAIDNLSKVYLDVAVNGEGVTYGYLA